MLYLRLLMPFQSGPRCLSAFLSLFTKKNHFTVLEVETDAVYLKCSPNDLIVMLYFVDVSVLPTGMLPGRPNLPGNSPEPEI